MYNALSKDLLTLLTKQLVLPWIKKHKCKQQFGFLSAENIALPSSSAASYCQFCEEYVLWFTFAKEILVYISPKQELELPETLTNQTFSQTAALNSTPSQSVMLKSVTPPPPPPPLPPTQPLTAATATMTTTTATAAAAAKLTSSSSQEDSSDTNQNSGGDSVNATPAKKCQPKTDPDIGVWVTSYGVYYFKISQLQPHLQLFYSMLKELYRVPDVDAFYNLLICIKTLVLHDDVLETANKEQKGFLIYCLEKLLVPKYYLDYFKLKNYFSLFLILMLFLIIYLSLWKVLSGNYCHLNDLIVPILLHTLVYESGQSTFWSFIEKDFKDSNWKVRMQAGKYIFFFLLLTYY